MKTALERHDLNKAVAISITLRQCKWDMAPFAKLQALPKDGKPIQQFAGEGEVYTAVARKIYKIMEVKFK